MGYDKKGYDLIKKSLEEDKAKARKRIKEQVKTEYEEKNIKYLGNAQEQAEARKVVMIKQSQRVKKLTEEAYRALEEKAWEGKGEEHFIKGYRREETIKTVKERFRNNNGESAKQQQPGSLTYQQNRAAEQGYDPDSKARKEYLKQRWKKKEQSQQQQKSQQRDQGESI